MKHASANCTPGIGHNPSVATGALLVTLLLLGCNGVDGPRSSPSLAEHEPLEDVCIELDRSECFGSCPSYSVTIEGNGRVTFVGRNYVSEMGRHEAQVSREAVRDLLRAFEAVRFFELENSYRQRVTCLSLETITLYVGQRAKRIHNYGLRRRSAGMGDDIMDLQVQESLFALADSIDAAARTELWIKTPHELAGEESAGDRTSERW